MNKIDALITSSISKYEEVLKKYEYINKDLPQEEIERISELIREHVSCHEEWENSCDEGHEMIELVVYGKGDNVALECMNCNTVIADSEHYLEEE